MTTTYRLTVEGLVKLARLERPDIADWIEAKVQENAAALAADLAQPIDTPAGQLIPGHRYNVTLSTHVYGQSAGRRDRVRTDTRTLRSVTARRGSYGNGTLVYESGRTAAHINTSGAGQVTAIEELS